MEIGRKAAGFLRRHPRLALCLAGMLAASALPPMYVMPGLFGFVLLARRLAAATRPRDVFLDGTAFSFGFFLVGLYWVGFAFFAGAERFEALAVPGVLGLVLGLALLNGIVLLPAMLFRGRVLGLSAMTFALPPLWLLGELVREHGLRFPWNPIAGVWAWLDAGLQPLAWIGVPGLGVATLAGVLLAGEAWGGAGRYLRPRRPAWAALAVLLLLGLPLAGWLRLGMVRTAPAGDTTLRIVQANIAQHHKWDPEKLQAWFEAHLRLTAMPGPKGRRPDIVIWPESSVPYDLDSDDLAREMIGRAAGQGTQVLLGSDHVNRETRPPVLHNSVYHLGDGGAIEGRYDKVDLVPFGEFLPFRTILGKLGLDALAVSSLDFRPGEGRRTMALDGLPPASPLVCYEAIFPGRATDGTGRARWLVNVTNDAWFGESAGPFQHFAMARMRAVETGLPLVRAANTGISAITDAFGRIVERLPLGQTGVIDGVLPPALGAPPAIGRMPWLAWLPALLLLALAILPRIVYRRG